MSQSTSKAIEDIGSAKANDATTDPDFIVYLLDPEQEYNCYFLVGNPDVGSVEKIGVVKKMLIAHSKVLRAELQDSKIAEKEDVKVKDIFPHTFKNLLRYVYGYDNTEQLCFDEADNLLYAAEKYLMHKLKNRLTSHLMSMLDCTNICSLLNNPACYTVLELNSAITEILQMETDQVLASPQFPHLSSEGFLKILEQEMLSVSEIELWRAAIKWGKSREESESGEDLRRELDEPLKHIRVCSISSEDIFEEVVPSKVLKYDEILLVSKSRQTGEIQPELTTICNLIEERESSLVYSSELLHKSLRGSECGAGMITESTFSLTTREAGVELCSIDLYCLSYSSNQCNCTLTIQKGTEPPVVVSLERQVNSDYNYDIPVLANKKYVRLSPNSSYSVKFSCSVGHIGMYQKRNPYSVSGSHFTVDFQPHSCGFYVFHIQKISYRTVAKRVRSVLR